jgi:hypothetical protein
MWGVIDGSQPGVDADVWFGVNQLAVTQKLVGAEAVALQIVPGKIQPHRPLILWSNPVLPVIPGSEITAGPTENRNVQVLRKQVLRKIVSE